MPGVALNLLEKVQQALEGRVCFVGLGNTDLGDDGFGVRLAEKLTDAGIGDIIVAGTEPEHWLAFIDPKGFDHLVFLDAVDFGGEAGSVVFLNSDEISTRYPQVSTHKTSLGLLARFVESNGLTRAWLLGVQPASLKRGQGLSAALRITLETLCELMFRLKTKDMAVC